MDDVVLVDSDIIFKISAYDAVDETIGLLTGDRRSLAAIGVTRFVLRKRVGRSTNIFDKLGTSGALERFFEGVVWIEPDTKEINLAAGFEEEAQVHNLAIDTGESLLLAVLVLRCAKFLLTGDKRAIRASEIAAITLGIEILARIACFEQLMLSLLHSIDPADLRQKICGEPLVDRTLAICFACQSGLFTAPATSECLASYVRDIRKNAPTVLATTDDLSAFIS